METDSLTKLAEILGNFLCYFKNLSFSVKTATATFWANLVKIGLLIILTFGHTESGIVKLVSPCTLKGHSHYCVFRVRLRQTVAFPQGDRKFPISALTQPTAENADHCV